MPRNILVTSKDVERLKQKARKLKRAERIAHHDALDKVARAAGFDHWHQLCQGAELLKPTENAYSTGCVFTMDAKEAMDFEAQPFIYDQWLEIYCRGDLYHQLASSVDEDDEQGRTLKETNSNAELDKWFNEELMQLRFYRVIDDLMIPNIEKLFELISKESFWLPSNVWLKGKYHGPCIA